MAKRLKKSKTARYKKPSVSKVSRANKSSVAVNNGTPSVNTTRLAVLSALRGKFWVPFGSALLMTSYSYALGLQEIQVNSNLGEPLSAMVYLSNPNNKRIYSDCFKASNGVSELGMPSLKNAKVRVNKIGNQVALEISTPTAVKEPISELTITSSCSTLPVIQRTYTLMLDPANVSETRFANSSYGVNDRTRSAGTQGRTLEQNSYTTSRRINRQFASNIYGGNIDQGSSYSVQSGDTLSTIAARISDRPYGSVWSLAAAVHASNPAAFTDNNPNLIELGAKIKIPVINDQLNLNSANAANLLDQGQNSTQVNLNTGTSNTNTSGISISNEAITQQAPVQFVEAPTIALPTMTATTRLSALSLDRIKVRASGGLIQKFDFGNSTSTLSGNTNGAIVPDKPEIANRPLTPNLPNTQSNTSSSSLFNRYSLFGLLTALLLMALATWKLLIPKLQRMARVNFFKTVRSHKKKKQYLERNRKRKAEISQTAANRILENNDIEAFSNSAPLNYNNNFDIEPDSNLSRNNRVSFDSPTISDTVDISDSTAGELPALAIDDEALDDFNAKSSGPRKARVAKEVYEVGMIDDTGELVSLTTAFPELEAELNARLGDERPDLGNDLAFDDVNATRQTQTMELNTGKLAGLQIDSLSKTDLETETLTIEMEAGFGDRLDLELPALSDDTVNIGADFETLAADTDLSKTMVFNEEVFVPLSDGFDQALEDPLNATTLSTELIDSDAETRLAPVLSDTDGLTPSDFGLSDDDFPVDRDNYGYLEPDASIVTEGLNLSQEELEELGMGEDDDNIIPFAPKGSKKSA